jgi:anion-transporting  ArsA/GET3 family ATPase
MANGDSATQDEEARMMKADSLAAPLLIVVGSGGVGKTTLAAALGLDAARQGHDTLVMTFDPSHRLKDTLGVGEQAGDVPIRVPSGTPGRLDASLLDARATFDRLIARYAPDAAAADRIRRNRFYEQLAGSLAGILEYMAVERLFEVAKEGRYARIILDTPPTRQALDFLQAPERIVHFLDSGAMQAATRSWFDDKGRLKTGKLGILGRGVEALLDKLIGLGLLRDIAEFFQAFGPLYAGFRERALGVQALLRSEQTRFLLVAGPGGERTADTLFFARKLVEAGCHLGPVVVNQLHPRVPLPQRGKAPGPRDGVAILHALGVRDHRSVAAIRDLLSSQHVATLALMPEPPSGLADLEALGLRLRAALAGG